MLGYEHYYEEGFATGAGFLGIAVALVGRSNPFGVVLAALFFATLSQGGLAINALVPKQMVDALQGVVILAMAASVPEVRRLLASAREERAMSWLIAFLAQTLRIAVPYLFAAAGGVLAERVGNHQPHARGIHAGRRVQRDARQLLARQPVDRRAARASRAGWCSGCCTRSRRSGSRRTRW